MGYRYETHLHTIPVSKCARVSVRENLECYKQLGYDGVFITNHFIDGNIGIDSSLPYEERIADEIGIRVFSGLEMSYGGTDFLVYGLDKEWFLAHPQIEHMKKSEELAFLIEHNALVIQAHPFREASYIDHIRLFPRVVHGVEVVNACCTDFENQMARQYAEQYQLLQVAGSDNHRGERLKKFAGVQFETPLRDELDFVDRVKNGETEIFTFDFA